MKIFTKKNIKIIFILLVLVLGFYLRFINYLKFDYLRGDEGNHFILFDNLIRFKQFWIVGEVSSLGDYDLDFYFHNMPYSLYFGFIVYFFANQSPLIYMFIYLLINISVVYFLWQTNKNFFGEKTGLITLFLASFSKNMITISTFASQPTNALIFESIGLYLLSLFYKKKKKVFLVISLISFLFALHMYPPMYLYLPVKIIFLLILFYKEIFKNKKIIFYLFLVIAITYLPMIINEINHYDQSYSNLFNIKGLISNGSYNAAGDLAISNDTNQIKTLIIKIKFITRDFLCNVNNNFYTHSFFIYPMLLASIYLTKNKNKKFLIYYFMFSIITPILILGIFNINRMDYIGGSNAFYFVLLMAISVGSLVKTSKNMSIISVFLISVFILTGISFKRPPRSKNIDYLEKHALIKQITNETNKDLLTLNEIDMKVLNNNFPNNNGNWDSSIYWYLLQKNSKTQLVDSSYPFLVPELINQKPKVTYFICEYENSSPNVKDCLTKINHDYDYSSKNMNRVLSESNKIILIKSKTNLNHNLNQDE